MSRPRRDHVRLTQRLRHAWSLLSIFWRAKASMASSSTPVPLVQTRGTEWSSVPSDTNLSTIVMPGAYIILMSNLRRMKLVLTSTETQHPRRTFLKCL
ncbi:hypothetical protein DFJ58DRAFT_778389 [Suillus subalutaceus]|uniref:uncharacterized protein n=1 Tax=Suillus subalutaceus TaxID=48586 RepID=UPI001B87187F|nr:uncharacterized protein DFJ58DRAFT_778389 [Suillus subalutaceus]KAG1860656.1 hypothetical protein DFJ58DRAFT_778389 [Suillus subalutaceus]